MIVATYRDAEIAAGHPMAEVLAKLHREDGIDRILLRGLGDDDVLALLETLAGHTLDDDGVRLRDALRAETDGNPFFTVEILRHLSETGAITQDSTGRWVTTTDLVDHGLPTSVREVTGQRVARLGPDTQRVLRLASVVGRDFDLDVLAEVADLDEERLLDLLEPALANALIAEIAPARFTFGHALIEHTLYDELSSTRRSRAHRAVAEALEARIAGDPGARAGELAHHWGAATSPTDTTKAVDYARQAGDYALAILAPEEATRWYERGLDLLVGPTRPGRFPRSARPAPRRSRHRPTQPRRPRLPRHPSGRRPSGRRRRRHRDPRGGCARHQPGCDQQPRPDGA